MSHPTPQRSPLRLSLPRYLILLTLTSVSCAAPSAVRAQSRDKVVAVVDGRNITQKEVDETVAAQLLPLQQQIYAIRKAAMENLIIRAVLEGEAKRRGVSVEELRRRLTGGDAEVTASQIEKEYLVNAEAFGALSPDEAREKIRLDLETRARLRNYETALSGLKEKSNIQLMLEEPKPLSALFGEGDPSRGPETAAITITEFSDFQCPYCRAAQATLKRVLEDYGKDVRLIYKHLPLDIHEQAFPSAQAAFCAGEQGFFWQYHDALFSSESLSPGSLNKIASSLGLNEGKFQACLNSEDSRVSVLKDMREAKRLGIEGTPTFIINGTMVRGAPSLKDFEGIIERELKSAQASPGKD